MLCIKMYACIVSGNIEPVVLTTPSDAYETFEGETAIVSGFGLTSESKCIDPFNLYSTDKK